jgi:hypothetical protein
MAVITNFGVPTSNGNGDGATLMPKLQYRFRVTFDGLGGINEGPLVTRNVISVSRPQIDHEDVTVDTYNSKIRLAGKHTWQDITLTLRDDIDSNVIKALDTQLSNQVNHLTQTSAKSGAEYKFKMYIETLDGSNNLESGVLDKWELVGCFLPNVSYGDVNYSSSEMINVVATIRFDNASHEIANGQNQVTDALAAGNINNGGSTETSSTTDGISTFSGSPAG